MVRAVTRPNRRPQVRTSLFATLALAAALAAGCDKGGAGDQGGDKGGEGDKSAEAASGKAGGDADAGTPSDAEVEKQVKTFLKDQRKKACEMLPPSMAAKALAVPEADLKQMKVMGCIYTWESEDKKESAQAQVMSIWVKKDADSAKRWFENATKDQTAEELAKQMEMVKAKTKERKEIDTKAKKKTVDTIGDAAVTMMGDGISFEDVEGVGDAARMNKRDGQVTVLVGNMIFNVQSFKGPAEPPLDMTGIRPTDTKAVIALAKKNQDKWLSETIDIRKKMSVELAKMVVDAL